MAKDLTGTFLAENDAGGQIERMILSSENGTEATLFYQVVDLERRAFDDLILTAPLVDEGAGVVTMSGDVTSQLGRSKLKVTFDLGDKTRPKLTGVVTKIYANFLKANFGGTLVKSATSKPFDYPPSDFWLQGTMTPNLRTAPTYEIFVQRTGLGLMYGSAQDVATGEILNVVGRLPWPRPTGDAYPIEWRTFRVDQPTTPFVGTWDFANDVVTLTRSDAPGVTWTFAYGATQ